MAVTTALYLGISQDDDNRDESDSIANQRDLLNAYVSADSVLSAGEVFPAFHIFCWSRYRRLIKHGYRSM